MIQIYVFLVFGILIFCILISNSYFYIKYVLMISEEQFNNEIELIIKNAIREDVGEGDHSSLACIPNDAIGKAKLLVKDEGIIAGVEFAKKVFKYVDRNLSVKTFINDGRSVRPGDVVFYVEGPSQSILKAERLVLNAMQRMSAIATKTKQFANLLEETKAKIVDTRKTTPGIRALEKWAVKIGGGENHRFALYDMIMLKDNHIDFAGGITKAIVKTKAYLKEKNLDLKIIVEARNLEEVKEILQNEGVYRILLDNFNYDDTRKAVKLIGDKCLTESSGGINEKTIREYAICGVNYISSGALTHSVYNMDLSLKAV
jgi:nicotinate-nucleotide pyrophosphorylase (carboxylating)